MVHRKKQSAATAKGTHESAGTPVIAPVIVVAGPTASGKSAAALAITREFGGTIINADSMQVYRDLSILSARPSLADLMSSPHRLYGVLDAADRCSAGHWLELAKTAIDEAHDCGRVPIVVGGTGLYLKTLMEGIAPTPDIPAEIRSKAEDHLQAIGSAAFHAELAHRDPDTAERIRQSDPQRMLRAWEVLEATGRSLRAWQQEGKEAHAASSTQHRFFSILLMPDRADLYSDCDARFAGMIEAGAVAEAAALLARNLPAGVPALKAVGVPEIEFYLTGDWDRDMMIAKGQQATRRYAKRQYTWFGKQMESNYRVSVKFSEREEAKIFMKVREFLLTGHREGLR